MFAICRDARKIGYTPSIFLRMLNEQGPVQTARLLINARQPSDQVHASMGDGTAGLECRGRRPRQREVVLPFN